MALRYLCVLAMTALTVAQNTSCIQTTGSFYDLSAKSMAGPLEKLSKYANSVALVVNVASF